MANDAIYTLKANGMYTVHIRVGHTLLYAYSKEEYAAEINAVVLEMDYFR